MPGTGAQVSDDEVDPALAGVQWRELGALSWVYAVSPRHPLAKAEALVDLLLPPGDSDPTYRRFLVELAGKHDFTACGTAAEDLLPVLNVIKFVIPTDPLVSAG